MGKQSRKNKKLGSKPADNNDNNNNTKAYNNDTAIFISMAQELKEEGNKLFQTKDYEEAILNYENALKLLPRNHTDVSYLRSNIAACYMQMGLTDFPRAIHECNLALEVTPKYIKALLKRSRCYEALNRLDLSLRDANTVLDIEPKNLMAMEIVDRVKARMDSELIQDNSIRIPLNEKIHKKKRNKTDTKGVFRVEENKNADQGNGKIEEISDGNCLEKAKVINEVKNFGKKTEDKEEEPKRVVKLVYGEDIRFAKIPINCDIFKLREIIHERFPLSNAICIKYLDEEGDMVTITTNEELRWAESSFSDQKTIFRLYVFEVNPNQDPFFDHFRKQDQKRNLGNSSNCIDDWILEFAQLFKNNVGFNSDSCLHFHELGMKLYSEAMEDTVTSEEAQELFLNAAAKFQEMAALALFNWGNVHMSRARKRVFFNEDGSKESLVKQLKDSYEWAQMEYSKASEKYEEAIKIKPDFCEGFLALGQVQFEKAKLSWYYALGTNINLETWDYNETVQLYNDAEDNIEKGMELWEEIEKNRVEKVLKTKNVKLELKKTNLMQDERENMRCQMNVLWGMMLYERSIMEYKLGIPVWHECLEISVEKFEFAGASATDIAVMIKNHCSNHDVPEGLGFNIDEIVQAWNEMYEAKMWRMGVPSFRLEPLLRRRVSKLFHALEYA